MSLDETHAVQLIDLDSVVPQQEDCVPPRNLFLAFFMFAQEVYSREVIDPIDREMHLLAPHNFHPELREIAEKFWQEARGSQSFGNLQKVFESLSLERQRARPSLSALPLWYDSVEHFHSVASNRTRERDELCRRLNDAEARYVEKEAQYQSELVRADSATEKANAASDRALAAEERALASKEREPGLGRESPGLGRESQRRENKARDDRADYEALSAVGRGGSLGLARVMAAGAACKAGVRRIRSTFLGPFENL